MSNLLALKIIFYGGKDSSDIANRKCIMKFNAQTAAKYAEKVTRKEMAVELEPQLQLIAEGQARASHKGWMEGKMAKGYVYGPVVNDDPTKGQLTHPLLVPYDELSPEDKQANIANAVAIISILRDKGCTFVNFTKMLLYPIAKQVHDEWAREKINAGWVWGPVTDKANKIHRDLVPFEVLAVTYPEDIQYDVDTARQVIIKMITENDVFPVISSLAAFQLETAGVPA